MSCMRNALASHYGDNSVAIGGTFVIEKGKANLHVMVSTQIPLLIILVASISLLSTNAGSENFSQIFQSAL